MRTRILLLLAVGMLMTACISGTPKSDSYTSPSGETVRIESDRDLCTRSCNEEYSRCMDQDRSHGNGGVIGPQGMFGASADCRKDLKDCLPACKGR